MKTINMQQNNSTVFNGDVYFYMQDETAWVKYEDISMPGDFMGLVAPSAPRWKMFWNGGIQRA